jgi:C-terminal processing protease CtpA/Prc
LERLGNDKRIAVLTSRRTFSAAMQLVVDLEQRTPAVFVGEPTGGSPNHYGDAIVVPLPNSGLNAHIATVTWMTAGEGDERLTREPDIPVPHESKAFFTGADPTLDAALAADS